MKRILTIVFITFTLIAAASAQSARVTEKDLKPLDGKLWTGSLTYIDYTSKNKTTIESNLMVSRSVTHAMTWVFELQYPQESGAGSKDEVRISPDGRSLDGEMVIERTLLPKGVLRIVTTGPGRDDNRNAVFRHTYTISKSAFSIRKEVKFDGTDEFFERNTYSWTR